MNSTRGRRSRALAASFLSLPILAGCSFGLSSTPSAAERTTVTVAVLPLVDDAPLYVGIERGIFARAGLTIVPKVVRTGKEALELLTKGEVDIGVSSNTTILLAAAVDRKPVRILTEAAVATRRSVDVLVRGDSKIRTPLDLAGKKFAVGNSTCTCLLAVRATMRNYGLDPNKVTFVNVPQAEMPDALNTGKADAVVTYEPWVTVAQEKFGARELFDPVAGPTAGLPLHSYATTTQFAEQHSGTVSAFRSAMAASQQAASTSRQAVERVIPALTNVSADVAAIIALPSFPLTTNTVRLQRIAALLTQQGLLEEGIDVTDYVLAAPG
jgi:NitT/TauT family transport system substrate-binding protein